MSEEKKKRKDRGQRAENNLSQGNTRIRVMQIRPVASLASWEKTATVADGVKDHAGGMSVIIVAAGVEQLI